MISFKNPMIVTFVFVLIFLAWVIGWVAAAICLIVPIVSIALEKEGFSNRALVLSIFAGAIFLFLMAGWFRSPLYYQASIGCAVGAGLAAISSLVSVFSKQKLSENIVPDLAVKKNFTEEPKQPKDATLLGKEFGGQGSIYVTDKALNTHLLVAGTTGGGKTVSVTNFVESFIKRGLPVIYIDGKGDAELANLIERFAQAHHRKYLGFSMMGGSCHYNPLSSGGYSSKKERLID